MTLDELSKALIKAPLPKLSGNVYCIGRNYGEHVKELKNEMPSEPVIFLKAPSALRTMEQGPLACAEESFHHEIELVLLIGQHAAMGSVGKEDLIHGVTLGLDLTRRDVQTTLKAKGLPWTLSKSFASAGILHPFVRFPKGEALDFELLVNGASRQKGWSSDMIFDFERILNFLLKYQDLYPGDIIYTGTPSGVAGFKQGDSFRFESKALGLSAEGKL